MDVRLGKPTIPPMRSLVLLVLGVSPVAAEVAGTVQAQRPMDLAGIWGAMANDALGGSAGKNRDDYRTNALTFQMLILPQWALVIDHAILTDKAVAAPTRLDEATVTLSWLPWRSSDGWVAIGGGIRQRDDLAGENLQNRWHDWSGVALVEGVPYAQPETATLAVATASGARAIPLTEAMTLPGLGTGVTAIELGGRGLVAHDGTWQTAVEAILVGRGRDGAIWTGLRYERGGVGDAAPVLQAVLDHEEGTWLVYGASVGPWFVAAGSRLDHGEAMGRLGFAHHRLGPPDGGARVEGDLTFSPGPALGAELTWRPDGWSAPWGWGLGIRFGNAGHEWADNVVEFRQIAGGLALSDALWQRGTVALEGYGAAELGIRQDRVVERGDDLPFARESHITCVAVGRAGVRIAWGDAYGADRTVRMGVGLGVVGWAPFTRGTVDNGTQREHYATPEVRPELALHVTARW